MEVKMSAPQSQIVITNVRVFNPRSLSLTPPQTLSIHDGKITSITPDQPSNPSTEPESSIDGSGCTLLPGLIDAHVHFSNRHQLKTLAQWGVTTALDMACWPPSTLSSYKAYAREKHLTDIRSAGLPLTKKGSRHSKLLPLPDEAMVESVEQVRPWVEKRVGEGADYVKVIADVPGPSQEVLDAVVRESRARGRMVVAHAASSEAWAMALAAGADVVTHVPMVDILSDELVEQAKREGRVAVPTLSMMEGLCRKLGWVRWKMDFRNSVESLGKLHRAGVKIAAGTDANNSSVGYVPHGESLHGEMELMIRAGLSNGESLRAATLGAAEAFGLKDRGVVEVGMRADLLLVEGDPMEDIRAMRQIRSVWCHGVEVDRAELKSWWYSTAVGQWLGWLISFVPGSV